MMFMVPLSGHSKLKVMTTTSDLKSLVETIGGDSVEVFSFCKGTQDPHYLEAKPSYMIKASKADLLISIGLELEVGWLPLVIRGARNPKIRPGQEGSLVVGDFIETLEKSSKEMTRADGDVHPEGNPHILLDPFNAILIAGKVKDKLSKIKSEDSALFEENLKKFKDGINLKMKLWKAQIPEGLKVVTYHKTMTYFYHRFGIENVAILEPKPGIPPTAGHILKVMKTAKKEGVQLALVENYFDPTVANRVAKDVPGMKVVIIPVAVEGEPGISNLIDLYDKLTQKIKGH